MYEEYFGLTGAPFKLNPDPRFFFGSRSHNKAMAYLHYGLKQAEGFIVITGPVGAGKTMLIGHLLDQLASSNVVAAQLLTSNVGPDELLGHILSAFRIEPEGEGRTGEFEAFEDYLFDQLNRGRRVLLIMDEAQNLPRETLEELRMLSNIDYDGTPLFQVFLIGQPEFRDTLASKNVEQLKQRVIASYHLEGLDADETREYILHRLSVVGWKDDPTFTAEAFESIYAETEGRPRRINTLANRLMLHCALEKRHEVTGDMVGTVVAELQDEERDTDKGKAAKTGTRAELPPVRAVERSKAAAAAAAASAKAAKVDAAPAASEPVAKPAAPPAEKATRAPEIPVEPKPAVAPATGSVFDRLRARRVETPDEAADEPPAGATLSDVATAIAAAASGENVAEPVSDGDAAGRVAPERTPEWKNAMLRSINETREELKEAHSSVKRLRRSLNEISRRRGEHREKIAASLARAESLLSDIRNVWR